MKFHANNDVTPALEKALPTTSSVAELDLGPDPGRLALARRRRRRDSGGCAKPANPHQTYQLDRAGFSEQGRDITRQPPPDTPGSDQTALLL